MAEQGQGASELPGARLALTRERLGLSVTQVAAKLHLDSSTVSALENGAYAEVGAPVFVRGFLRRYAELVGEPAVEFDALYAHHPPAPASPDLARTGLPRLEATAHRRSLGSVRGLLSPPRTGSVAAIGW